MSAMGTASCFECQASIEDTHLEKCPICFRHFCADHGHRRSGRAFCTEGCADYFFFSEPDDEETEG
jgi:hypothetical protein